MKQLILKYVKEFEIKIILRKKEFSGLADVLVIDFIGKDKRFYSFLFLYNDTAIFTKGGLKIGKNIPSIYSKLADCLVLSNTKEEWIKNRWDISFAKGINDYLFTRVEDSLYVGFSIGAFCVVCHQIWTRPIIGFSIHYSFQGELIEVLNFVQGCKTIINVNYKNADAEDFALFLEGIGVAELIEIYKDKL